MIGKMHIENFKCFKDFDIELGPFNVLVGPNDSGKTAFLDAIRLMGAVRKVNERVEAGEIIAAAPGLTLGKACVWQENPEARICMKADGLPSDEGLKGVGYVVVSADGNAFGFSLDSDFLGRRRGGSDEQAKWLVNTFRKCSYYSFSARSLREPSPVKATLAVDGEGFPTYLDNMSRRHRSRFLKLLERFQSKFPVYTDILLDTTVRKRMNWEKDRSERKDCFTLAFRLQGGAELSAAAVSDGLILWLAFTALAENPEPPSLLLVEEPENGVHYSSLKDAVEALKKLADEDGVQVILTTHSPYLLDLVEPEEVRVFSKDEEGAVHASNLSDHPEVGKMKKHFMTGEIWTELGERDVVKAAGRKA